MSVADLDPTAMSDAHASALLFAFDPHGFGGIAVRSGAGPLRDHWLGGLRALMPAETPWRRLPAGTAEARLDGGLDLAATLSLGRPVMEQGLLGVSDGGIVVAPMAERLSEPVAARLAAALDTGRAGDVGSPARFGLVALDEGLDDERVSPRLRDRLSFWTDLSDYDPGQPWPYPGQTILAARARCALVVTSDAIHRALIEAAVSLEINSLRAPVLAQRAARALTALAGRDTVTAGDAALAARLVLAPRATQIPQQPDNRDESRDPNRQDARTGEQPPRDKPDEARADDDAGGIVLAAAKAALPPGLLLKLQAAGGRTARQAPGRAGATQAAAKRGRPIGVRRGQPRGEARLSVIETLRAAAPWQALRVASRPGEFGDTPRLTIRRDDFRFTRFKQRTETVTLFAVDASGSLAAHRLAEAKGAVELLLAECYVRRDQVALLAFRNTGAELLLPPTRSLARAKRCLAGLAGGGATPLAGAIDAAVATAEQIRRQGRTPVIVFLTDGRANVARDGTVGRAAAEADARSAAVAAGASGVQILVVDAAQRPQPPARALAEAMRAQYVPLPRAEAASLTAAVRNLTLA